MYIGIEGLIGSAHNDTLIGNGSANTLRGGRGNDALSGLGGADILDGGAGNDCLRGGAGNDTFLFARGFGSDTIADWQDGPWFLAHDYISFQGAGLSMADLSISYSGGNAVVSVAALHGDVTVLGVLPGSLGADDFLF
jgi:Ca2+-binding RTX toxin-like protein